MKLIVVSNRLPLTVIRNNDKFEYKHSSGGLVTGLNSIKDNIDFMWLGNISSFGLSEEDCNKIREDCSSKFNSYPVFIDPQLNHENYNGFCNAILWPMLHYFVDDICFTNKEYASYVRYNKIFCDKISEILEEGDIVWVHDYHLMILPKMLRDQWGDKIKIMFFLHTPFPSSISLNALTCRNSILSGITSSDLVSFHSYEYALNFLECCTVNRIKYKSIIDAIPIGIDPVMFTKCLEEKETVEKVKYYREKFANKRIIIGVDRTDYIKGIPQRVVGFNLFLQKYPEYKDKVAFIQIGVPSRTEVKEYQAYVNCIDSLVSDTNSTTGSLTDSYIFLLNQSVDFSTLCALYSISDVLLITSLRDGMNLVAMEYISCQDENHGVLVLSEFTGVTSTLPGSVTINAWNSEEIADSIYSALEMNQDERSKRHEINRENIYKFTSLKWAEQNLDKLSNNWKQILHFKK